MTKNTIIVKTFEFTDPHDIEKNGGRRMLDISIDYVLGGYNYFSYKQDGRGYRVDISPYDLRVNEYNGKTYTTRETSYGTGKSGGYVFIEGAKRKSAKRMQQLADALDADAIKDYWLNDERDDMITKAKEATA